MASLNKVFVMGNCTRDPEMIQANSGESIAKFGLAINSKWTSKDGQKREDVVFINCTAFGQIANVVSTYLRKGNPVFIEGRLKLDQWQDKSGQKRSALYVVAERIQLLDRSDSAASNPEPEQKTNTSQQAEPATSWQPSAPENDSIPF